MEFVTRRAGEVEFLAAQGLGAPHGFSTRLGGVSGGIFQSLNLGLHRGDRPEDVRENYRRFQEAIGAPGARLCMADQVHGICVRAVTEKDAKADLMDPAPFQADGLVTDVPGLVLTVFTADCIPILLCDPVSGAVGALHAGWRGTAAGIGAQGVAAMERHFGTRPEHLRAAIGPGIGPCCFESDADVPRAMEKSLGTWVSGYIQRKNEKFFVDLKGIDREVLLRAGVPGENVAVCGECTCCHPERYWSHRYTHGERGSQAAMIWRPKGDET